MSDVSKRLRRLMSSMVPSRQGMLVPASHQGGIEGHPDEAAVLAPHLRFKTHDLDMLFKQFHVTLAVPGSA
jgi:hypothetical protein